MTESTSTCAQPRNVMFASSTNNIKKKHSVVCEIFLSHQLSCKNERGLL